MIDENKIMALNATQIDQVKNALNNNNQVYRITLNPLNDIDYRAGIVETFFHIAEESLFALMSARLTEMNSYKVLFSLCAKMSKALDKDNPKETETSFYFHARNRSVLNVNDVNLEGVIEEIEGKIADFIRLGSGWILDEVDHLDVTFNKMNPLGGGTYMDLPKFIADKKACINVKNNDNKCFMWSLLAATFSADKNPQRTSNYLDHVHHFHFNNIQFPVQLKDIPKFETLNNINVVVIGCEKDTFRPVYCNRNPNIQDRKTIPLLIIYNEDAKQYHYVWIKDVSRLLSSQVSKHKEAKHFCLFCFQAFGSEIILNDHKTFCMQHSIAKTRLPKIGSNTLKFKNHLHQYKLPFAIYADFECILEKQEDRKFIRKHVACSFAMQFLSSYAEYESPYLFRGNEIGGEGEVLEKFYERLSHYAIKVDEILKTNIKIHMTEPDNTLYNNSDTCYICKDKFSEEKSEKYVKGHDHFIGKYRCAAHSKCNLKRKQNLYEIPVVIHNLNGYHFHLIV